MAFRWACPYCKHDAIVVSTNHLLSQNISALINGKELKQLMNFEW